MRGDYDTCCEPNTLVYWSTQPAPSSSVGGSTGARAGARLLTKLGSGGAVECRCLAFKHSRRSIVLRPNNVLLERMVVLFKHNIWHAR